MTIKSYESVSSDLKDMMRDPHFPFENEGLGFAVAEDILSELWNDVKEQKSDDRYIKFYEKIVERIERMKKKGKLPEKVNGIKKLEKIRNAV